MTPARSARAWLSAAACPQVRYLQRRGKRVGRCPHVQCFCQVHCQAPGLPPPPAHTVAMLTLYQPVPWTPQGAAWGTSMLGAHLNTDLVSLGTDPPARKATSWQGPCTPGSTLFHRDTDMQAHRTADRGDTSTAGGSTPSHGSSVSPHGYVHSEHVPLPPGPKEAFVCSEERGQEEDTW